MKGRIECCWVHDVLKWKWFYICTSVVEGVNSLWHEHQCNNRSCILFESGTCRGFVVYDDLPVVVRVDGSILDCSLCWSFMGVVVVV